MAKKRPKTKRVPIEEYERLTRITEAAEDLVKGCETFRTAVEEGSCRFHCAGRMRRVCARIRA